MPADLKRKGIILAGGKGTRLYPVTLGVSKQLAPIYNKPMIYYPLSVLMLSGIREVCIITTPDSADQFISLLGDGNQWGMSFSYINQPSPDGLAQAYILAKDFLNGAPSAMVLGDNIFYGSDLQNLFPSILDQNRGCSIFLCPVKNPYAFGNVLFNKKIK